MKVLQLCNKPPLPKVDGGCIAIYNVSDGLLQKGIDLKILTASTSKHPFLAEKIPDEFKNKTKIEGIFLDTKVNLIDAFSALITSGSYNVNRFFSPDFDKRLVEILKEDDYTVVHLESLFMTPYIKTIRSNSKAKIILRSHNLEHLIWERLAYSAKNPIKKMYLHHLASKLKKYESKTINEVDGIATITEDDTYKFKDFNCKVPITTIPFGIKTEDYPYTKRQIEKRNRLFHIGAMNWQPNQEAINWFTKSIWPLVKNDDLSMHLAGRKMPSYINEFSNDKFHVHGEVESAQTFMAENDIMLVPLLSGSGVRIKIIEAMASAKAIITTSIGAEGINYTNNEHLMIANSPEEFAKAIKHLISHPKKVIELGLNARKIIEENYDNSKIMDQLILFYSTK